MAVVGGGGADRDALQASLDRGCETYVTGGVFTRWAAEFLALADEAGVAVIDGTHYGTEKPPSSRWSSGSGRPASRPSSSPTDPVIVRHRVG